MAMASLGGTAGEPISISIRADGVSLDLTVTAMYRTATRWQAYRDRMRVITITLNWTNTTGRSITPRSRQWQTQVARFGMQNYVFGGL